MFIINPYIFVKSPPIFTDGPTDNVDYSVGVDVIATINENGYIYVVVLPNGSTAPTSNEVVTYAVSGSLGTYKVYAPANTSTTIEVRGLLSETSYDLYVVAEDLDLSTTETPIKLDLTTTTSPVYNSVANGFIIANASTVWDLSAAPIIGATMNIKHYNYSDGRVGGYQGQPTIIPYLNNRTINISGSGCLEFGDVALGSLGGYYPFWDLLKNTTVNVAPSGSLAYQYAGDANSNQSQGIINFYGDAGVTALLDFQDQGFETVNIKGPGNIFIDGYYTAASAKNGSLFFSNFNVEQDCKIIVRPGVNDSSWKCKTFNVSDTYSVYTTYTTSITSNVQSISGSNNTVYLTAPFTTGISGQLIPGRYLSITGSSTTANNVSRCIKYVANDGLSCELFGAALTDQGSSGTAQVALAGNPNTPLYFLPGRTVVTSGKSLELLNFPTFNDTYKEFAIYFTGNLINDGTIVYSSKNRGFSISEACVDSPDSKIGNIIFKDNSQFRCGRILDTSYIRSTKVASYELDKTNKDTICTVTNISGMTSLLPTSFGVDGIAIGTGLVNGTTITFSTAIDNKYPLYPGMLLDLNNRSGPVRILKSVSGDRKILTLYTDSGITNTSRTIVLRYVELAIVLRNFTDSCKLNGTAGYIKRLMIDENKIVISGSDVEDQKFLSSPQGDIYVRSNSNRLHSLYTEPLTFATKSNIFNTGNFTFQDTASIYGAYFNNGGAQIFGGNWIFEGTSHKVWFGGYGSIISINNLELKNNTNLILDATGLGQNGDLRCSELKMTNDGTISSIVSNRSGRYIYLNTVSGSGKLTFRPRSDAATSATLNRIRIDTNSVTFSGGVAIERGVSTNQICWEVYTGLSCTFQTLTIEGASIAAGTYATNNAALLGAFTGSGSVIVNA
jgi:hypothetical protein